MDHRFAPIIAVLCSSLLPAFANAQGTWTLMNPCSGVGRIWATAFTVNGVAYAGTGVPDAFAAPLDDMHAYDAVTGTWTNAAPFPGGVRDGVTSIGHGSFGYAGFGSPGFGYLADWYKYDPTIDSWSGLPPCPVAMGYARGFVIGDVFYVGPTPGTNAMYAFDFVTETWSTAATFPGTYTIHQVTFTLNDLGYLGMGLSLNDDWWRYDADLDSWTQVASISPASTQSCGFAVGNMGYVFNVGGNQKDLYSYDSVTDAWAFESAFTAGRLSNAEAFTLNGAGYIVFGEDTDNGNTPSNDLWRFDPGNVGLVEHGSSQHVVVVDRPGSLMQVLVPPAFIGGTLTVCDALGRHLAAQRIDGSNCTVAVPAGTSLLLVEARSESGLREVVRLVRAGE